MNEWLRNDRSYKAINQDPSNTFKVGHNKFSDWTQQEILSVLNPEITEGPKGNVEIKIERRAIDGGKPS